MRSPSHFRKAPKPVRRRPELERLEDRTVPALVGSEFHVNTTTMGDQYTAANATSSNGMSVAVWVDHSGPSSQIAAQMYDSNGNPMGHEIRVTSAVKDEVAPTVAMDNHGNWRVAWVKQVSANNGDVIVARFSSQGVRQGGNITVAASGHNEFQPSIACDATGNFVVSYTVQTSGNNKDVRAVMYSRSGAVQKLLKVAVDSSQNETNSSVARSTGNKGAFVIAYQVNGDVYLKHYSPEGKNPTRHAIARGAAQQVNPSVTMDDQGRTMVAWQQKDGGNWDVFARRLSNGTLSKVFTVANTSDDEAAPSIALDRTDGDFVVTFRDNTAVDVQEMNKNGTPKSGVIQVVDSGGSNPAPAVSIDSNDFYFITFTAVNDSSDPGKGIFGQFGQLS